MIPMPRFFAAGVLAMAALAQNPPAFDPNPATGPALGAPIPPFQAVDQNGRTRSFDDLKGPKGLVLLFVRSADW